jgi:2-oxoglutarate ferredoxin oxidoreductase subunit gamma
LYDTNGITNHPSRTDIKIYRVEAAKEAARMGSAITFNMIVLGAYLKIKPLVSIDNVVAGLKKSLPERHHKLIPVNVDAINRGMKIVAPDIS